MTAPKYHTTSYTYSKSFSKCLLRIKLDKYYFTLKLKKLQKSLKIGKYIIFDQRPKIPCGIHIFIFLRKLTVFFDRATGYQASRSSDVISPTKYPKSSKKISPDKKSQKNTPWLKTSALKVEQVNSELYTSQITTHIII